MGGIKKIVPQCEREGACIRILNDGTCVGWEDPPEKWKDGQCPEFSTDPREAEKINSILSSQDQNRLNQANWKKEQPL